MLIGKVANGGPKKLAKGAKITRNTWTIWTSTTGSTSVRPTTNRNALEAIKESIARSVTSSTWPSKRSARS
jgi:DNA-directed RNA polymerase subunit beta